MNKIKGALWGVGQTVCAVAIVALLALSNHAEAAPKMGKGKKNDEGVATGFINKTLAVGGKPVRYVVYVPYGYDAGKAWPLIFFLHGAGERGDDGLVQTEVGIGSAIRRNPERFPAVVVLPQCPKDGFYSGMLDEMEQMLAETRAEYNIDDRRITLTGLSMGGYGTWLWGAAKADTFAALMPICGGGRADHLRAVGIRSEELFGTFEERVACWKDMPIWAFHGADDSVVPVSETIDTVEAIKAAGGKKVKFTEYPDTNHNSWDKTYQDKKVIAWLLKQKKD